MSAMKVPYEKVMRDRAKAEGLTLVTLDITGKHSKRSGVTFQGFLFTPEEVEKCWEFFNWLAVDKRKARKS